MWSGMRTDMWIDVDRHADRHVYGRVDRHEHVDRHMAPWHPLAFLLGTDICQCVSWTFFMQCGVADLVIPARLAVCPTRAVSPPQSVIGILMLALCTRSEVSVPGG